MTDPEPDVTGLETDVYVGMAPDQPPATYADIYGTTQARRRPFTEGRQNLEVRRSGAGPTLLRLAGLGRHEGLTTSRLRAALEDMAQEGIEARVYVEGTNTLVGSVVERDGKYLIWP